MKTKSHISGFTLIELMVATVLGMMAITAIYAIGATSTRRFGQQADVSTTQNTARFALEELRRTVARAGLFATPNLKEEQTCGATTTTLPLEGGGTSTFGAIQYYVGDDSVVDANGLNGSLNVRADRLRILGNVLTSDRFLISGTNTDGTRLFFQQDWQAFRRTFLARPLTVPDGGIPIVNNLFSTYAWNSQLVHIETKEGMHFFRTTQANPNGAGTLGTDRYINITSALPIGTACAPGQLESATVAPVTWVDYRVINPFATGSELKYTALHTDLLGEKVPVAATEALEGSNAVLVRREISTINQTLVSNRISIVAEYVVNFQVSFWVDTNSGNSGSPVLALREGSAAETYINGGGTGGGNPEHVRSVIIQLDVRTPFEDPDLPFSVPDGGMAHTFDVDDGIKGSSRIRQSRIEIPVPNIASRNL